MVREILDSKLEKYPKGAFFLFFQGRFSLVQGHCTEATEWYLKANQAQDEWPQFHHVACWEMVWSASYRCMWRESLAQASRLLEQYRWSPCLYSYLKAAYYCMLQVRTRISMSIIVSYYTQIEIFAWLKSKSKVKSLVRSKQSLPELSQDELKVI